jgi:hypothetical protein
LQTEPERNAGLSRRPLQEQKRPAEAGPICYLRIGIAGLVVRHFGIILCRSLTLLAGFLTAALLLAGLRGRRLILLPGLVLVRHDVSFHGNASTTERHYNHNNGPPFRFVPDKEKPRLAMPQLRQPDVFGFASCYSCFLPSAARCAAIAAV